jgi:hypothetical protein
MMLPLTFAALNRARGADWGKPYTSKGVTSVLCGVIAGVSVLSWQVGVIVALGVWFWAIWGWGDYFDFSDKRNDEIYILDWFLSRFIQPSPLADGVAMSLRGLFIAPMFIALAFVGYHFAPFYGLVGALQGIIYYTSWKLLKKYDYTAFAELLTGFVFGLALYYCIS